MALSMGLLGGAAYRNGDYELIATVVLGSNASSVMFSNLATVAAGYKHLQIRAVAKSSGSASDNIDLTFNGDTGNNYSYHALWGNGSSAGSESSAPRANAASVIGNRSSTDTNAFDAAIIDILNFASTKNKVIRSLRGGTGGTGSTLYLVSNAWYSATAVTSITLTGRASSIAQYSRFSLYGIRG